MSSSRCRVRRGRHARLRPARRNRIFNSPRRFARFGARHGARVGRRGRALGQSGIRAFLSRLHGESHGRAPGRGVSGGVASARFSPERASCHDACPGSTEAGCVGVRVARRGRRRNRTAAFGASSRPAQIQNRSRRLFSSRGHDRSNARPTRRSRNRSGSHRV